MLETEITRWIPRSCGDRWSLTVAGDTTFSITKGPSHLWSSFLVRWVVIYIVLCIQPNLSFDFVGGCGASLAIIVLCHLICSMLKSSFRLVLHLRHSLGEVVCGLYSRALGRLRAHPWVLA